MPTIQAIAQLEDIEKRISELGEGEGEALRHHVLTKQIVWSDTMESCRLCVWYKMLLFRASKLEAMYQTCTAAVALMASFADAEAGARGEAALMAGGAAGAEEGGPPPPGDDTMASEEHAGEAIVPAEGPEGATAVAAAAEGGGGSVLPYLPEFYLDSAIDALNALVLRRTGEGSPGRHCHSTLLLTVIP